MEQVVEVGGAAVSDNSPCQVDARFDIGRAWRDLERLCAPSFAGRRIGSDGHDQAQRWLVGQMQQIGLDTTVWPFTLERPVLDLLDRPELALVGDAGDDLRVFEHRTEIAEHPRSSDAPIDTVGPIVAWQPDVDVHGAWVMLTGVPPAEAWEAFGEALVARGAVGLLLPQHATADGFLVKRVMAAPPIGLPVLSVRDDLLPALVGRRLRGRVPLRQVLAQGGHVLGRLNGSDAALDASPLIVGAHYDGMGDDPGGHRFPCAGDNAAAVAVVLEVARVLGNGTPPRRPIVFVAFDGEEVGAQGASIYARWLRSRDVQPSILNLDGAARWNDAVAVEAGPGSEEILAALGAVGREHGIPLVLGQLASDNRPFARAGLPTVGIGLGAAAMHTPADNLAGVDPQAMQIAGQMLLAMIRRLSL